jgi:hypothetical protein
LLREIEETQRQIDEAKREYEYEKRRVERLERILEQERIARRAVEEELTRLRAELNTLLQDPESDS